MIRRDAESDMTVLVTGGAGYIGSHMVLDLVDRGEDVIVLDDLSTGFDWLISPRAEFVRGDIADDDLIQSLISKYKIDAIAHFAAKIVVPESVTDPLGYYKANTCKALSLITSAVKSGVQNFIFSSTAAVYGDAEEMPVRETTRPNPVSPYGHSKLMVEQMLHDARHAHGLNAMILRYFNVAGADPDGRSGQSTPRATHLVKTAVEVATGKRETITVFGTDYPTPDGTCIRDYIHVSDLARAHVLALDAMRKGLDGRILNCAYGHGSSVLDVIETVKRVAKHDFPVGYGPRRAGDPPQIVASGDAIRSVLNWQPRFDNLDLIVEHALSWERHLAQRNR